MKVQVIAYCDPIPKGRPRFSIYRGHVHTYTPKKTADYERLIADAYKEQAQYKFERDQALNVKISFGMPIPKSTTRTIRAQMIDGLMKHTKKPDVDNLIKSVLDALNGIAWEDDAQIVKVSATKEYSIEPYVCICINESVE